MSLFIVFEFIDLKWHPLSRCHPILFDQHMRFKLGLLPHGSLIKYSKLCGMQHYLNLSLAKMCISLILLLVNRWRSCKGVCYGWFSREKGVGHISSLITWDISMSAEKQVLSERKRAYFWNCHHPDARCGSFSLSMGMVIKKKDSGFAISNRTVLHFILSCFQIWRGKRTYLSSELEDHYHSFSCKVFNAIISYTWGTNFGLHVPFLGVFGISLFSSFAVVAIKF